MGFVLQVYKTAFQLKPLPLKCFRPLVFQHIELSDSGLDPKNKVKIEEYVCKILHKMIQKADLLHKGRPARVAQPLVRLKIEFSGYDSVIGSNYVHHFRGKIANLSNFIHSYKRSVTTSSKARNLAAQAVFNSTMGLGESGGSVLDELARLNKTDDPLYDEDSNENLLQNLVSPLI